MSQMKVRYVYPLLFLVPSAVLGLIVTAVTVAAGTGILWIYVFGDDPWPASAGATLFFMATLAGLGVLAVLLQSAYRFGMAREGDGGLRRGHVLLALGLSVGLPFLVVLHQWRVGNLGGISLPPDKSSEPTTFHGAA
ncbi:hypothetical protein GCM10028862_03000 [Luteimonas pelagia]